MPTHQKVDTNGYLTVSGCPLTSFGIFEYSAGQLGLEGDPMRIVKVYRPESEVSDPAAIASFQNLPFIDEHSSLSGFADDDETGLAPEEVGIDGILTGNVYYEAPWVRGDLKVFSRKLQKALAQGKRDLSLGYDCRYYLEPGEFQGQQYEVVQRKMRGNHIALVEEGRVPGARVLDGKGYDSLSFNIQTTHEENHVENENQTQDASPVEALQALLPQFAAALQAFLKQEAGEAEHKEQNANAAGEPAAAAAEAAQAEGAGAEAAAVKEEATNDTEGGTDLAGIARMLEEVKSLLTSTGSNGAQDNVEGLAEKGPAQGAMVATDNAVPGTPGSSEDASEEQGKEGKAADAALARFYADSAAKAGIYDRLSAVVGAFDCRAMDSAQVYAYGVKKLGLNVAKGQERHALDAYLTGVEAAEKRSRALNVNTAADSAVKGTGCDVIDNYIKQGE